MKYKHIFFDLDHTLWDFDTNATLALEVVYNHYQVQQLINIPFAQFGPRYIHHNNILWDLYHNDKITAADLKWKRMYLALLDFKYANETLAKDMSNMFLTELPLQNTIFNYTHEILQYLKTKGYQLHLITNGFEDIQRAKLANSNLTHYFTALITSELANSLKPKKEIFDFALAQTGAQLHQSIMLGDNLDADIGGAKNAGWDCIFVNHINAPNNGGATFEVKHLKELENIL
jgi:putative hydrolase of the HAD superfamily